MTTWMMNFEHPSNMKDLTLLTEITQGFVVAGRNGITIRAHWLSTKENRIWQKKNHKKEMRKLHP
jgi:hypothetical protein